MRHMIAFAAGMLFGMGMLISQMVNPVKVINFLNVSGNWDPSLAFVMGGALFVFAPCYHFFIKPRQLALSGEPLKVPVSKVIDKPLLIGASLFGIGWGLAGICPGPAITALVSGQLEVFAFVLAMLVGQFLLRLWPKRAG